MGYCRRTEPDHIDGQRVSAIWCNRVGWIRSVYEIARAKLTFHPA
jgi:hypothetical protein